MSSIREAIQICAKAIEAAYVQARNIAAPGTKNVRFVDQSKLHERIVWGNSWSDVTGFIYEQRVRACEIAPLCSFERFALEQVFELPRQRVVDRQIAEDAVPAAQAEVVKASQRWKERKRS